MSDANWGKLVPGKGRPQSAPAGGFGGYTPTSAVGGGGAPGGGTAPFAGGLGGFDDAAADGFDTSFGGGLGFGGGGYGMQGAGDPRMSSLRAHPGQPLSPYGQMVSDHRKARADWYKTANEARYGPQGMKTAPRGGWTVGPDGVPIHGTGRPTGGGYGGGIKAQPYKYMGQWVYPSGPGGRPGRGTGNLGGDVLPGGRLPASAGIRYHGKSIGGYGGPGSGAAQWQPQPVVAPGPYSTVPRQQGLR